PLPLDDEGQYERRKARLRLVSCALTLLMAVMLAVLLATFDATYVRAVKLREAAPDGEITDEQRFLLRVWMGQWVAVLVVMFTVLVFALLDVWATRRFALRQFRKIHADRRAMLQGEAD